MPLRAVTAQLLCATGAAAALAHIDSSFRSNGGRETVPRPLAWAPLVVAPVAAAAQLEHARQPRPRSADALRLLDGAVIALGGVLFLADLIRSKTVNARNVGALAFASVGLLGLLLERHQEKMERTERRLRLRADVVERLVPRRRPRLDRVVVHV